MKNKYRDWGLTVSALQVRRQIDKPLTERKREMSDGASRYRIVSRPNGLWSAQVRMDEHGKPEKDHWQDIAGATTKAEARRQRDLWNAYNRVPFVFTEKEKG